MGSEGHWFTPDKGKRLFVVLGAFGTGKTEFSINLALKLRESGRQTALCDLDLVNPYFRSREKDNLLEASGVRVIAPEGALRNADLPSIPPGLWQLVFNQELSGVLDIGGDSTGARVLGAYAKDLYKQQPAVYYVFNQARYDNADKQSALGSLRRIEARAGLRVNGLVHNTHLLGDTTADLVRTAAKHAERFAMDAGLPLVCHCVRRELADELPEISPLFPMGIHMNRPWED